MKTATLVNGEKIKYDDFDSRETIDSFHFIIFKHKGFVVRVVADTAIESFEEDGAH